MSLARFHIYRYLIIKAVNGFSVEANMTFRALFALACGCLCYNITNNNLCDWNNVQHQSYVNYYATLSENVSQFVNQHLF